jgi:ABA4-like protein
MAPEVLFKFANLFAVAGWICLIAGIVTNRPWLRDRLAGLYWPMMIAAGYALAIIAGWSTSEGGFASLPGVRELFANDWVLLAGWMHYLAFDLFVGAWIAAETERANLSRLVLVPVLPLTFLLGPTGFLLFNIVRFIHRRSQAARSESA